jgi:threonine dehydratase
MNFHNALPISSEAIHKAQDRITPLIRRTPLLDCSDILGDSSLKIKLKLENLQVTGSFKIRGALNKMLTLSEAERKRGVITVSSGNHGRAVSYAANQMGIQAIVCLPETVPQNKISAIRKLGAEVIVQGRTYDESDEYAHRLQKKGNLTFIHPFDDPAVIAGQGTIGLELLEEYPEIETVVVPLSGGGLLSGIALALKSQKSETRIIGVTIADALAGGIGLNNRFTFRMIQELMDEAVLVSEEEIARAMTFALEKYHIVIEGGGAVGLAAILENKIKNRGHHTAIVISGGNVEIPLLNEIYHKNISSII